jgi:hypothetical protein
MVEEAGGDSDLQAEATGVVTRRVVGVSAGSGGGRHGFLLKTLGELYPVEFRMVGSGRQEGLDALLVLDGNRESWLKAPAATMPTLVVTQGTSTAESVLGQEVRFGSLSVLDACLRGQVMMEANESGCWELPAEAGDEVLATKAGYPVWIRRLTVGGPREWVGIPVPALHEGEFLFEHLNGQRFMGLLPIMHFLRQLVKGVDWQAGAPRACFVFDDPSLYWHSYGFLDFRLLASHSAKHAYSAAVATIPIDTWWVNSEVGATFRSCHPRLSLLIHGDNHTFCELASRTGSTQLLRLAAEARRRIERMARRHQLQVQLIMEAPHGVIADGLFEHLLALGYEAALGTTESLVRYNPRSAWPAAVGMDRAEMLGGGLPVIPRIRMSAYWKNDILLAAFLRQPIVIAGHHRDADGGYELLAEIAQVVRGLEGVSWASPREIVQSNYKELRQGEVLHLRLYSRRMQLRVPDGVEDVFVHRPWTRSEGRGERLMVQSAGRQLFDARVNQIAGPIRVAGLDVVEICSPPPKPIDYGAVRPPRGRCWPVMRKALTEVRDRSAPCRERVTKVVAKGVLGLGLLSKGGEPLTGT